jgi:hypothetical protein
MFGVPEEVKYISIGSTMTCNFESQIMEHRYSCAIQPSYQSPQVEMGRTRSPSQRKLAAASAANPKALYHAPADAL